MENIRVTKFDLGKDHELNLLQNEESRERIVEAFADFADKQSRDEAMYIIDLGDIVNKYKVWTNHLPSVKPFYAVKANNDHMVLHLLAKLGVNFDCASKDEIERVLSLGVSPDRIVYSHPCKHDSMLKFAAESRVAMTTFDNADELLKIKRIFPKARCLIRIRTSMAFKVKIQLGYKYGCLQHEVGPLLKFAKSLGLEIIGVHFHVGYLCQEADAYHDAIALSRNVFDMGRQLGFDMNILDIGGGFPGKDSEICKDLFKKVAQSINIAIDKYFPDKEVTVIAEPGEYFVASALTLATKIIARKIETPEEMKTHKNGEIVDTKSNQIKQICYYLNDGFYGSFASVPEFCVDEVFPHQLKKRTDKNSDVFESTLFGPTCDSLDVLPKCPPMREHNVGEWIYFPNMGAYTTALSTSFNGMPKPKMNYICLEKTWNEVFPKNRGDKVNVLHTDTLNY